MSGKSKNAGLGPAECRIETMNNIESLAIQPNVYYTLEETAKLLRVSRQAVLRLLQSQRVYGIKIGNTWRVLGAALLDLSERGETETALVSDWLQASSRSLGEVWDNEEDAVYGKERSKTESGFGAHQP